MSGGDDIDRMLEAADKATDRRSRDKSPSHKRSRDRPERERSRDRAPRDRGPTSAELRIQREQLEIERDQRTVFCCQIHPKCDEIGIFEFFSEVGRVLDIQLIREARNFKSKGLSYIEFEDKASVPQALGLSGQMLGGYPVSVQMTQAEKNRAAAQAAALQATQRPMKLYVADLDSQVTEDDLYPVFSAFGDILQIDLQKTPTGQSLGYGFVEYRKESEAIAAMGQLNGLELLGRRIRVTAADGAIALPPVANRLEDESGNAGMAMSTQGRVALMQKLGGGNAYKDIEQPPRPGYPPRSQPPPPSRPTPQPSQTTTPCLLLTNMFDPSQETDPDFDLDIREDVMEEVGKYGNLKHIYVDKTSRDGRIYLRFGDRPGAQKTSDALSGRWFAQNQIKASYMEPRDYTRQFPDS